MTKNDLCPPLCVHLRGGGTEPLEGTLGSRKGSHEMIVALSFNPTWIEHLGTLTHSTSVTRWALGRAGALEGDEQ